MCTGVSYIFPHSESQGQCKGFMPFTYSHNGIHISLPTASKPFAAHVSRPFTRAPPTIGGTSLFDQVELSSSIALFSLGNSEANWHTKAPPGYIIIRLEWNRSSPAFGASEAGYRGYRGGLTTLLSPKGKMQTGMIWFLFVFRLSHDLQCTKQFHR